ncbi:MAG TPA: CTP synthase (glutamine hydrolyzing) [Nitrososphaeraceae archaeon]|nr:CTP synthase (glutamine hydrolyzing) [Nitrososphaeraceae archaeon]
MRSPNNIKGNKPKFIFITGGVMSGLGKGVITSSTAKLLQLLDLKVSCIKIDPYVNYDAGTMNPIAHGEVFVTEDGGECDMDIGNYERFLDNAITKDHNITTGRIYLDVIQSEREGKYLGQCVQIIPHITDAIKKRLRKIANDESLDVMVVECGGTVGDIESLPFLEALRQMELEDGHFNTLFIHVTLAPIVDVVGEQKTKPTQHSVQELRRIGIQPDILAVRCKTPLTNESRHKISLFASVEEKCVISCHDAPSIYKVPEILESQGMLKAISEYLSLSNRPLKWANWKSITKSFYNYNGTVTVAVVGKYVTLPDSYVSVYHALLHASAQIGKRLDIKWIDSEEFEDIGKDKRKTADNNLVYLRKFDGILVPGGFGKRGSTGIINVVNFAREENIPYLGICFGFQLAISEFARNVCNLKGANSTEIDPYTKNPVVIFMPEQRSVHNMGGTMRLGRHEITIVQNTGASKIYGKPYLIHRRHRHRYELNQKYRDVIEKHGMVLSGYSDYGKRIEMIEIPNHRFYFAVQYHPEFNSRPGKPEQVFKAFMNAASHYSSSGFKS